MNLARMYEAGTGLAIDEGRALFWYALATEWGAGAVRNLASESVDRLKRSLDEDEVTRIYAEVAAWKPE